MHVLTELSQLVNVTIVFVHNDQSVMVSDVDLLYHVPVDTCISTTVSMTDFFCTVLVSCEI